MWIENTKDGSHLEKDLLVPNLSERLIRKRLVTTLGGLGILPFCVALLLPDPAAGLDLFLIYSLAILCFLSGAWWATALIVDSSNQQQNLYTLIFSNVVVLLGVLLVWVSSPISALGLGLMFLVLLMGERYALVFKHQPAYYVHMRTVVTSIVVVLHVGATFRFWT